MNSGLLGPAFLVAVVILERIGRTFTGSRAKNWILSYLVLGASSMAVANVGLAAWTQLRSINAGEPRAIIALDAVEIGGTHLFRYPNDADPAVLLRVSDDEVVAFSQKCTHLGCVVYFEADEDRWHCPCHEGNFEATTGAVISGPPTRPLGRIDVETRADGMIWALGRVEE